MGYSADQINQYMDYVRKNSGNKYTPEQWAAYENHIRQNYLQETPGISAPEMAVKAAGYGARAMDVPGGVVRSGVASVAGIPGAKEDLKNSLKFYEEGKGVPNSRQYLEKANFSPGTAAVAGPVLDLVSDPLNWPLLGRGALMAGGKLLGSNALVDAANAIKRMPGMGPGVLDRYGARKGQGLYDSAFKLVNDAGEKYGKGRVSDLLLKNNISGSARSISRQAGALADSKDLLRQQLLEEAHAAGAAPNIDAAFAPGERAILDMRNARSAIRQRVGNRISGITQEIKEPLKEVPEVLPTPEIPAVYNNNFGYGVPTEVSAAVPATPGSPGIPSANIKDLAMNKSDIGNLIGDASFNTRKEVSYGNRVLKRVREGLQKEVENSAERAVPGLGQKIGQNNSELGTLLSTEAALNSEARKELTKNMFSSVDGILMHDPTIMAMKKAADVSKGMWWRTTAGKNLFNFGKSGLITPATRNALMPLVRGTDDY